MCMPCTEDGARPTTSPLTRTPFPDCEMVSTPETAGMLPMLPPPRAQRACGRARVEAGGEGVW